MSEYISKEDISRVLLERTSANESCLNNARELRNHEAEQHFHKLVFEDEQIASLIEELPSAFEGMTNGKVIQALFPEIDTHDFGITVHATERVTCCGDKHCRGSISYDFWKEWWNAPYKKGETDGK